MVDINDTGLSSTWIVVSATDKLIFWFCLILINLNVHMCLETTVWTAQDNSTGRERGILWSNFNLYKFLF